ncbi:hypothetical protein [Alloalcanivorax profundimaris]|uniref:hypothetical protein n=1 Tax=Alloalcanivorax profundimaris TaxID=2735259 RepID=UPI0018913D48|nr:hypothetical protein [Alloalcanivorax profundimaris]
MDQKQNFADDRLIIGCIYCGGPPETRDHVPSRILLEPPYPDNLPVVDACLACNHGFSKDEQYFVCLLESVLTGSTDPEKIKRPSVAKAMQRSPALRSRIEAAKTMINNRSAFIPEGDRIKNIALKLARGHAAFELSQPCTQAPDHYWCGALDSLTDEQTNEFGAAHIQQLVGEMGSRNMQRMFAAEATLQSQSSGRKRIHVLINDWVEVQESTTAILQLTTLGE